MRIARSIMAVSLVWEQFGVDTGSLFPAPLSASFSTFFIVVEAKDRKADVRPPCDPPFAPIVGSHGDFVECGALVFGEPKILFGDFQHVAFAAIVCGHVIVGGVAERTPPSPILFRYIRPRRSCHCRGTRKQHKGKG
jgi:hypothetical protein